MELDALVRQARAWMAHDPDPDTREATQALIDTGDHDGLRSCFGGRLQFGTAGLRGEVGPGPNRMNRLLVRRVTAGLATYLRQQGDDAAAKGVVVAFDGRNDSRRFADEVADVLGSAGLRVYLSDGVVPTPFLAFATLDLGAAAGVMITASHNPPKDNGYKVFWGNGAQIVPPHDTGISAAIDAVDDREPLSRRELGELIGGIPATVRERYLERVADLRVHLDTGARVVYSAMHGVGTAFVKEVLHAAGHTDLHPVPAQADPDGDFPTVAFPNPEEPGALDLSKALADEVGADVVLANDPDADRLAVAIPDAEGVWTQLTGNQVGILLAEDLLSNRRGDREPMVATTIVSTAMLKRIADAHGARYAETLTGFKWIADRAIVHDKRGGQFVLGFEEALGYSAGSVVRDKDGVSAALLVVDLISSLQQAGRTLWDALEDLYRQHGLHLTAQRSFKMVGAEGKARIASVLGGLRDTPPTTLGGVPVAAWRDLKAGEGRRVDGSTFTIDLPTSDVLAYDLEDGSRVLVRPSGTEPKIKLYFEVRVPVADDEALTSAQERGSDQLEGLVTDLLHRTKLA